MIIAQCHLSHLEQAGLHRHRLVERGMAPSADAYATMIASSKDTTDDAQVARELWTESQSLGVRPHLYLYNTVISKLSKARKADTALEMFGQMKERGVRPSSVTYGAVIVGHPNRQ
jgi:pentatricopeptide repeat protein